jgi:glycosyltransferase involved in cell wall biosynthesis
MKFSNIFSRFRRRLTVAVDFVRLLPGGENGGVKPAVFSLLEWMGRREGDRLIFIFIVNQATRDEVLRLARPGDRVWCSHHTTADPDPGMGPDPVDTDRLVAAGVDLLYCPFGPDRLGGGRIPFVSLLIDLLHREVPEALPSEEVIHREQFFTDACSRAAAIHVISDDAGDRLVAAYGLDRDRLFRTYLPLQQIDAPQPANRGWTAIKGRTFIYPANFWRHKNHPRLLGAFRLFLDEVPKRRDLWSLILTGARATAGDDLDRVIGEQELRDRVIQTGYLERADYLATLRGSAGLVYPSLNEGFGIPILEAQQAGVPVACSNLSSLPEVAGAGALFFDPTDSRQIANAMAAIAESGPVVEKLLALGHENLSRFDFETEAGRFADRLVSAVR